MKLAALATLFSLFQIAIAAAPIEKISLTPEQLVQESSFTAELPFKKGSTSIREVTAYSSTVDQTDDTPCIAASGLDICKANRPIIAANFLEFGTKVQFPKIFGDKIFVVEDRMNKRYNDRIDIWFPNRASAKKFGIQMTQVVILED